MKRLTLILGLLVSWMLFISIITKGETYQPITEFKFNYMDVPEKHMYESMNGVYTVETFIFHLPLEIVGVEYVRVGYGSPEATESEYLAQFGYHYFQSRTFLPDRTWQFTYKDYIPLSSTQYIKAVYDVIYLEDNIMIELADIGIDQVYTDTIIVQDTSWTYVYDTIIFIDTIPYIDTIPFNDTIWAYETEYDTVITYETEYLENYINVVDTATYQFYYTSTSYGDVPQTITIRTYPNPATDVIYFNYDMSISEIERAELYNLTGSKVSEVTLYDGEVEMDVSQVQAGTYVLIFRDYVGFNVSQSTIIIIRQ